jgi:ABC-type branched-subunit amino acid transport system permease subunit
LLIGLVVTAAVLGGGGWAVQQAVGSAAATPPDSQKMWIALGAMAAVGLVVGLVVAGRISPLATFVPSMVMLAWTVVYALDMNRALSLIPAEPSVNQIIRDAGSGDKTMLSTGVFALLGVVMFIPVLMPSRWSRPHDDLDEDYEATQEGSYY